MYNEHFIAYNIMTDVCLLVDCTCTKCSEYFVQLFEPCTYLVGMLACVRMCVTSQLSRATLTMHESPRWWASILAPTTPHTSSIYYARNTVIAIRHHACMHRPRLDVNCACTTYNWHELRMHRTNSPQSCFGLVNEATKDNPPPLPFSLVMRSLPASFLSFLFCSHACLLMHDLPAALSDSIIHTGHSGSVACQPGECAQKKKKTGKTFSGRESVSVPRQGTSKRPRQGLASVPRQGTGKRTQAGYWQAYPGRDCKCSQAGNCRRPQAGDSGCSQAGTRRHCSKNA